MNDASIDVELSTEKMDQLVKVASEGDETGLAALAADVPRLVIEVTRLREELNDRVKQRDAAKRRISELTAYIDALRPSAQAQQRLRELETHMPAIVARAEKAERERDEASRTIATLEERVKTLLSAMGELARGTPSEQYAEEVAAERSRAEKAEQELERLREILGGNT
jgi:chromosome segregation ATPase